MNLSMNETILLVSVFSVIATLIVVKFGRGTDPSTTFDLREIRSGIQSIGAGITDLAIATDQKGLRNKVSKLQDQITELVVKNKELETDIQAVTIDAVNRIDKITAEKDAVIVEKDKEIERLNLDARLMAELAREAITIAKDVKPVAVEARNSNKHIITFVTNMINEAAAMVSKVEKSNAELDVKIIALNDFIRKGNFHKADTMETYEGLTPERIREVMTFLGYKQDTINAVVLPDSEPTLELEFEPEPEVIVQDDVHPIVGKLVSIGNPEEVFDAEAELDKILENTTEAVSKAINESLNFEMVVDEAGDDVVVEEVVEVNEVGAAEENKDDNTFVITNRKGREIKLPKSVQGKKVNNQGPVKQVVNGFVNRFKFNRSRR